jgi:hypothetical protein
MEWPKIIYETFGPKYPLASMVIVTLLGGLVGGVFCGASWWLLGREYERDRDRQRVIHAAVQAIQPIMPKPAAAATPAPAPSSDDAVTKTNPGTTTHSKAKAKSKNKFPIPNPFTVFKKKQ